MSSLQLPIYEKEHYGDIQVRFGPLPLYFGPVRSASKFYRGKGRIVIHSPILTLFVCSLPVVALILSILVSLYSDFEEATKTHCGVPNVLPSISTAISSDATQDLWRFLIYLHAPPRFLAYVIYRKWLPPGKMSQLCRFLYVGEIVSLLLLTYYDSNYSHSMHVTSFTLFGVLSICHMVLHIRITSPLTSRTSTRWKSRSLKSSLVCLTACFLLFIRHNEYCEPYVFSVFASFEYTFVLSNVLFHSTFRLDFPEYALFIL